MLRELHPKKQNKTQGPWSLLKACVKPAITFRASQYMRSSVAQSLLFLLTPLHPLPPSHCPLCYFILENFCRNASINEEFMEKEMATHSSILAWEIPLGQRSLQGYSLWSLKRVAHNKMTKQQQYVGYNTITIYI